MKVETSMAAIESRMAAIENKMTQIFGPVPRPNEPKKVASGTLRPLTVDMQNMVHEAAVRNGVDPNIFENLVSAESGGNPNARSPKGAMGLTQLMPGTAAALGVSDPFDPEQNLDAGAKYLRSLMDRFQDPRLAVAAYNAGPGAVKRYGDVPPFAETQAYVAKVLGDAE
jgi:soluble lytic murein transglycosylase-like protein